ncbi:acetyl-CoA carboxylase biotin carboxyl carrier protein [Tetragenococcus muriaticus]|uniref:Biotin carboxyl carrier protein of acetyl-CoA carboxylase n=2 Tax=Tetragenococcus muriaticus TaxID=64642 RepID=A0A091C2A5_9ENTE|nr:acetyl-CoA carboxylase biotin carboxyl carrier protein [Tetragenococcus muriaticus]KFN90197.1 biotin carboxyl carrier protein of acetyl-CoA carboxylase [Tetragenococcus muriaticus 3MR10-3]KFN90560.1 biotin carboxyl carrier protein of acetyl-CoA carboxylase [Tetragenococcus muriaticus PMC-11-5]
MQQEELKDLLTIFDQSSLTELNLKDGGFELYFNKTTTPRSQAAPATISEQPAANTKVETPTTTQAQAQQTVPTQNEQIQEEVDGTEIVSPIVGVIYLRPAPEKTDFKKVGDHVEAGEVVCIVEAMKVMNEITSDVSGEIVEVLVDNEEVVEFNQPLFKVKEG